MSVAAPWPVRIEADSPAIRTRGLTKRFRKVVALDDVALTVPTGSVYLLVGPNGAGKTTTTRILLDLTRPTAGEVEVLGLNPHTHGADTRAQVGYVPERTDIEGAVERPAEPHVEGQGAARLEDQPAGFAGRAAKLMREDMQALQLDTYSSIAATISRGAFSP